MVQQKLGGTFTFPGTSITVHRLGYGAMQLAGPGVFGPPKDRAAAIAVLRAAVAAGVNHIDTSDYYGPHVTNQIIREALHPYPKNLTIVTKLGARRGPNAEWFPWNKREDLIQGIEDNLRHLGLDAMDIVNVRAMNPPDQPPMDLRPQLETVAELQQQGKVRHIGISTVTPDQFAEAEKIVSIVCVQNEYNMAHRGDDAFIDQLAQKGVAYVPYFPLGGFSKLQSAALDEIAATINATPMQVALAWLLHRSPNILLIPGTSSLGHLEENLASADLDLPAEVLQNLDQICHTFGYKPLH